MPKCGRASRPSAMPRKPRRRNRGVVTPGRAPRKVLLCGDPSKAGVSGQERSALPPEVPAFPGMTSGFKAAAKRIRDAAMTPALAHVESWIFDLDNSLYPHSCDLFALIDARMGAY